MATNPDRASYFPAIERKHGEPMSYWFDRMDQVKDLKYPEQMAYLQENYGFSRAHANALVMYSRGSTSSRRVNTVEEFLKPYDATKKKTVKAILAAITEKFPKAEVVIAWNKPMVKIKDKYVFGVSVASQHILIAPFNSEVIDDFRPRLADFTVLKKTIQVPVDWKVNKKLVTDMVAASAKAVGAA